MLKDYLYKVSEKYWAHKVYGSFHFPWFTITDNVQRDTLERYDMFKIVSFKGYKVLDLGCNTGAMSFRAKQMGASSVVSVDYNVDNIKFCRLLKDYLELSDMQFSVRDVDDMFSVVGYDVIFCLAINHWVLNKVHLYELLNSSGVRTIYFESNDGKLTDELPAYELEYVGSLAGRFSYICRLKV